MGNNEIIVQLGLEDMLKESYSENYQPLEKNIGSDKNILVRDLYNYMVNPERDELNSEGYTEDQKDLVDFIEKEYNEARHPQFKYKLNLGGMGYMQFNQKLSNYPDAFHTGGSNVEFGNLEESSLEKERIYLEAHRETIGGKK